jgi:chemotaxis protein methyltransferase CheR
VNQQHKQCKAELDTREGKSTISHAEFEAIREFLYDLTGIALSDNKRDMVCARLAKRLRHHGLQTFADYYQLLQDCDAASPERQEFINCLTTNKTDFFREPHHFDFLRDRLILPLRAQGVRRLRIWSSACSTGEEPYTLAMMLAEHCPASDGWDVRILASDIDTAVLATAEKGVYDLDRISDVPEGLRKKYFLYGQGANTGKVVIKQELRELIKFRRINLMDDEWPIQTRFDAIFCRNVVIYFDRPTQQRLLERFANYLTPEGYLFMGHSENIHWMGNLYTPVGGTVYRLRSSSDTPPPSRPLRAAATATPRPELAAPATPVPEHNLILGDVKTAKGPAVLKTLLGSCVSACLFDPVAQVGGMNHFSLPGVSDEGVSARYGAHAMELLITAIMKQGGERHRLRAKVFGGAKVLNVNSEHLNVGTRNAEFVLKFLANEGIPVDGQCLGGTRGLIVRFRADTGKAWARPLAPRDLTAILGKEEQFGRELLAKVESPADDGITLF